MRLVVRLGDEVVNEFHFKQGPIHIGRHADGEIFLPNRVVSRHHCVIYNTQQGKWMVEDMDSANKTFVNGQEVRKAQIKTGDVVRVTDYVIEVDLEDGGGEEDLVDLEDTLAKTAYGFEEPLETETGGMQIIARKPYKAHAPDIKLPIRRIQDFIRATEEICRAKGMEQLLKHILNIVMRQFTAYHIWCSLRPKPSGEMTWEGGKRRDGQSILLTEIKLREEVMQAVGDGNFLLLPRIPAKWEKEQVRSAMIAPVIDQTGCFGVVYVDNAMDHRAYTLSDLDYLMLLCIHIAAIVENF